jgi:hypothetical protein
VTRRDFRRLGIWIIGYIVFLALFVFILVRTAPTDKQQSLPYGYEPWIFGTSNPAGEFEETFTVPVNSPTDIVSKRDYAGAVSIIIRGEGHLGSQYTHDAFYAYQLGDSTKHALNSVSIDGREYPMEFFVERPRYNANHEYGIIYSVGEKFRPIRIRIVNSNSTDTSMFTVEVSTRNLVSGDGR